MLKHLRTAMIAAVLSSGSVTHVVAQDSAAAQSTVPGAPQFGALDAFVGGSFVSSLYTLDLYREGDALALHFGDAGKGRWGRFLVLPGNLPGSFVLAETTFPSSPRDRLAYADATNALVFEFTIDGYRHRIRVGVAGRSLQVEAAGAERRFGRFGAFQPINSNLYQPVNEQALQAAASNNESEYERRRQVAQEQREAEQERSRNMAAIYKGLEQANEQAAHREAESRAALDSTLQAARNPAQRDSLPAERDERERTATTIAPVAAMPGPSTGGSSTAPSRNQCTMIHPKVNDTFNSAHGEQAGKQRLREKAAQVCLSSTGQKGFSGEPTCTMDGPYVAKCAIIAVCAGEAPGPQCSGRAQ
jgi:hypothetical protein